MTVQRPDPALTMDYVRRFQALYSASVYDILDRRGFPHQVFTLDIKPVSVDLVVAGWALPVKGTAETRDAAQVQEQEPGHPDFFGLMECVFPGCVLVIEAGKAMNTGHWGELTSTAARARGCVGVVIDGGTRDTRHIRQMNFPVFSRYWSCVESQTRWHIDSYDVPIYVSGATIGGVVVKPYDFIFGDCDGVLCIPGAIVEEVLLEAEGVARTEDEVRQALRDGENVRAVFDRLGKL